MPLKFAKIAYGGKISFIHNANDNQLYTINFGEVHPFLVFAERVDRVLL